MKLIDRYLLREYLVPLSYCLCGFCMLYMVLCLFDYAPRMIDAGLSFREAALFSLQLLVSYTDSANICFVVFVLPVSILSATLYSLFRLNRQNELMAMRASGMSLLRLVCPYLVVGLLFSAAAMWVQECVAPGMSRNSDNFRQHWRSGPPPSTVVQNHRYYDETQRRRWSIGKFDTACPESAVDVQITVERADRTRKLGISADKAEWRNGTWYLYGVTLQRYGLNDEPAGAPEGPRTGAVAMPELTETPHDLLIEANPELAAKYSSALAWLRHLEMRRQRQAGGLVMQEVNAHVRLAMPWVCLVVAMISVPAGVRSGRRGAVASIAVAFLLVLCFYFAMQLSMVLGKKTLLLPWVSAWLPNASFFIVGAIGISRME